MEYQVIAEITPPATLAQLDELQQHGVSSLLSDELDLLAAVEGPDGVEVEPIDHTVTAGPTGVAISWTLDAPALEFAEHSARHVLGEVLSRTPLADWAITRCEVSATDEQLEAALADEPEEPVGEAEPDAATREELLAAADQLGGLGPEAFGPATEEQARLFAGALVLGIEVLTDELFQDIQGLEDSELPASEQDTLWVLDELPERFADEYTALFAKQFLVSAVIVGHRLCRPGWDGPHSTAEALVVHLLRTAAETQLELAGLADELPLEDIFTAFDEAVFADFDHLLLYEAEQDGVKGLDFADWFRPKPELTGSLHPYLADPEA
ncbi:hypothetical protein [Amycolatopsis suaedae]|uniref:Uncharacterized protein n=1 Tax=Amycolatopsis suaedae TaxID=2510978 RepID=A0A4Q7J9S7_9PSEU|nr:hypothetical protein [Amycolatopsis suaedae]RZQ63768.1 hypothetical protein EWH70_11405 [Amycolatopsis suaedae]